MRTKLVVLTLLFCVSSNFAFANTEALKKKFSGSHQNTAVSSDLSDLSFSPKIRPINFKNKLLVYSNSARLKSNSVEEVTRGSSDANIFRKVSSGTVFIYTEKGTGSGALITEKGHIVTNHHVVGDNKTVDVFFKPVGAAFNSNKFFEDIESLRIRGKVLKVDEVADLALVKIEKLPSHATPIPMLDSELPLVGDDAHAVGHPAGNFWTYTRGYVSQVRTEHTWQIDQDKEPHQATIIQTQTPINPGNSGGPLVDETGQLIGINTYKDTQNSGLNFAVATETVQDFLRQEGDRYLASVGDQKQPTKNDSEEMICGDKIIDEAKDYDDAIGDYTILTFDPNCVGRVTFYIIVPDRQAEGIMYFLEHEEIEGVTGTMLVDQDRDDKIDFTFVDVDGDGEFDFQGTNKPGEDIASNLERIDA